jgi:cytochrome P450
LLQALKPEIQARLYEFYAELRTADDCYWDRHLRAWVVTSYELVTRAAVDSRLSAVRYPDLDAVPGELRPLAEVLGRQMLYTDAPDHPRLRRLVSKAFTPRAVELLRAQVTATVDGILATARPRGKLEVVSDLAFPLPMTVICDLLDIPSAERAPLQNWSAGVARVVGNSRLTTEQNLIAVRGMDELIAYFRELIAAQAQSPTTSLLSGFLTAEESGTRLSEEELLANSVLLLIAGHETTTHFIGNATLALLRNPDQLKLLRGKPEILPAAIEELLRYDGPLHLMFRRALGDFDFAGRQIGQGEPVVLVGGAASHDPAAFPDPATLDLTRSGPRHLAFGHGPHFCLGAGLARLEGEVALHALITQLPGLRLASENLSWIRSLNFRGLDSLEVSFTPSD